jgi:hypothetical protein
MNSVGAERQAASSLNGNGFAPQILLYIQWHKQLGLKNCRGLGWVKHAILGELLM